MRTSFGLALLGATLLSGCGYFPVPPDPIRIVDSPADVVRCQPLGAAGPPVRTDGKLPYWYSTLTKVVPATSPLAAPPGGFGVPPDAGDNLAIRINAMRDVALSRGATDLLLERRYQRDWSYVQGFAYRCRSPVPPAVSPIL